MTVLLSDIPLLMLDLWVKGKGTYLYNGVFRREIIGVASMLNSCVNGVMKNPTNIKCKKRCAHLANLIRKTIDPSTHEHTDFYRHF